MAKPVSEEELQLKKRARRRLVGAVALVAAVAVVLPMVLDSEPKPTSQEINIQIPSPDAKGFTSKVVPLASPGKGDAKEPAKAAAKVADKALEKAVAKAVDPVGERVAETPVAKPAEKTPAPKPVAEKPATKVPEKVAEKAVEKAPEKALEKAPEKAHAPKAGTFYIQVTALADADRAKAVQQQIIGAGLPAYTQTIPAGKGSVTRVRAGPFATRAEADKAQAALQSAGLEGKVVTVP